MVRQAKAQRILTHDQIWGALDRLAARAGLSPSGLAKRAGLDPTTFNKSKRVTSDGRERWPSTESIAKALAAADSSIDTFAGLIGDDARRRPLGAAARPRASRRERRLRRVRLSIRQGLDRTCPSRRRGQSQPLRWRFPAKRLRPAYRDGDIILVSPGAPIRKGDRVVVKTKAGEVTVATLKRRTAKALELQPLDASQAERTMAPSDVGWIARIVWASQ